MTYRSETRAAYHRTEAATSLGVALDHIGKARQHDVDPAKADPVYDRMRRDLALATVMLQALGTSRQPDLARETAAIGAAQGGAA